MNKRVLAVLAIAWIICSLLELSAFAAGSVMAGDIDGDGSVTVSDLHLLLKHVSGQDVTLYAPGDVNGDGTTDIGDAVHLVKYPVGLDLTLYQADDTSTEEEESSMLQLTIGNIPVPVTWEDNESVQALRKLAHEEDLSVQMSMYGGFEQVGSIGANLPRDDVQTTTGAGDIVLYSGNQIVIFYGSNTWAYTRLGHVDLPQEEMTELLGSGDVIVTISD